MAKNIKRNLKKVQSNKSETSLKNLNLNVNKTNSWSLIYNSKPLSRNTIYLGNELPEFLIEKCARTIHILTDKNGNLVDDNIRQKVKMTIVKYLTSTGCKWESKTRYIFDKATVIDNVPVKIKKVQGKGWAIIIKRRKAIDVSKATIKVLNYLEKKGIIIEDKNICPMYCIPSEQKV